jgi:hypothetical protein
MSTMRMLSGASVTQSTAAVVSLLKFLGKSSVPLPEAVDLDGLVLVLSNKRDVYYTTTPHSCSCPSATYRPGQVCKHRRKHFPDANRDKKREQNMAEVLEEHDRNLSRMPASYRRMVRAARDEAESDQELKPEGSFKPFLE